MNKLTNVTLKSGLLGALLGFIILNIVLLLTPLFLQKNELTNQNKTVVAPAIPASLSEKRDSVPSKGKEIRLLKLNPKRTILINEQIDSYSERFADQILEMDDSNEPIVIIINSPGGSVFSGEKIVSAIESVNSDVYTVCDGMCASMAAIIHQYGTKRFATDRSVLMFHDAAGGTSGRVSEMVSLLTMIKRKLDRANHYIANRSKVSYDELIRLESSNYWIDAEDSLDRGFVDGLVRLKNKPKPERVSMFGE